VYHLAEHQAKAHYIPIRELDRTILVELDVLHQVRLAFGCRFDWCEFRLDVLLRQVCILQDFFYRQQDVLVDHFYVPHEFFRNKLDELLVFVEIFLRQQGFRKNLVDFMFVAEIELARLVVEKFHRRVVLVDLDESHFGDVAECLQLLGEYFGQDLVEFLVEMVGKVQVLEVDGELHGLLQQVAHVLRIVRQRLEVAVVEVDGLEFGGDLHVYAQFEPMPQVVFEEAQERLVQPVRVVYLCQYKVALAYKYVVVYFVVNLFQ